MSSVDASTWKAPTAQNNHRADAVDDINTARPDIPKLSELKQYGLYWAMQD